MADDEGDLSPRPFRRERNLSNRNFNRQSARRRFSTESRSSAESANASLTESSSTLTDTNSSGSAVLTLGLRSYRRMKPAEKLTTTAANIPKSPETPETPQTPDPALLDVRRKVQHFETLQSEDRILFKTGKFRYRVMPNMTGSSSPMRVLPTNPMKINEERSEDEVDDLSDFVAEEPDSLEGTYSLQDDSLHVSPVTEPSSPTSAITTIGVNLSDLSLQHSNETEKLRRSVSHSAKDLLAPQIKMKKASVSSLPTTATMPTIILPNEEETTKQNGRQKSAKDFVRNYRTTPRPKTQVLATRNHALINKFHSLHQPKEDDQEQEDEIEEDSDECVLRNKGNKFVKPILEELIKTEESYVENLLIGIENYGNIFQRKDLPIGLRGKKYVLLGNVEQIVEFHRDEFLPMLKRNRNNLKRLFDEFLELIEQNCFYGYVIFTMNKQRSLKLCDIYKSYFKIIQNELDDKLGINSFLVQPIQRMARYPLLLDQFITTFFKNRNYVSKELLRSCCRLEKRLRTLLVTTNESEVINDIVDCNEFNVFYQGKFRKVSEFQVYDYTLRRSYRAKVFMFDKCIIYTEIKGKNLIFHGRYPCEHVGIFTKNKTITLFYDRRKQQECDFTGDQALIELWLDLIRDMINCYAQEERAKLQERYTRENDHILRQPPSLSLFRDSNRFSSDSGIGNIWVMPKPEAEETPPVSNRTTWYAVT